LKGLPYGDFLRSQTRIVWKNLQRLKLNHGFRLPLIVPVAYSKWAASVSCCEPFFAGAGGTEFAIPKEGLLSLSTRKVSRFRHDADVRLALDVLPNLSYKDVIQILYVKKDIAIHVKVQCTLSDGPDFL
jgi:hypothetical protein